MQTRTDIAIASTLADSRGWDLAVPQSYLPASLLLHVADPRLRVRRVGTIVP